MNGKRLLILNGSSRKKGTSYSFSRTIKMLTEDTGNNAEIIHLIDYFDGKESLEGFKNLLLENDIIALVAPLYADALPYHNIWFFERIINECSNELKGKSFFAVSQCGFPDITRCQPMLDQCKFFADESGMKWLGGLAYGFGSILNGDYIETLGRKGKKIILAFKLALEDVLKGQNISNKPQKMLIVRIPKIFYRPLAMFVNKKIKKNARKLGVKDIEAKVYLE
jgi:multimeric flavodoxin WrbA